METPLNPLVADIVNRFDARLREDFNERAAIMEFDAELPRAHAECLALLDVLHRNPVVLTGITVLQVEAKGAMQYWVTTDLVSARKFIADTGGSEVGLCSLADVINQQFSGIAVLAPIKQFSAAFKPSYMKPPPLHLSLSIKEFNHDILNPPKAIQ